ncbi:MAG: hypothetical protein HC821_02755 [Lewinella sp.]|nr:hypothetical protein [Lewinella sp.]
MGMAIAAKLLPLLLLPLLVSRLWWRPGVSFAFGLVGVLALSFWPLLWGPSLQHFLESFRLYFSQFEFNGSLYYLLRDYGYRSTGFNQIAVYGPLLARLSVLLIFGLTQVEALACP